MEPLTKAILDWLASQGIVVLMLGFALKFGYDKFTAAAKVHAQTLEEVADKHAKELKVAWDAKEKASEDRFSDLKERVNASDRRHDECERSKAELQKQIFQMALMTGNELPKPSAIQTPEEK